MIAWGASPMIWFSKAVRSMSMQGSRAGLERRHLLQLNFRISGLMAYPMVRTVKLTNSVSVILNRF